MRKALLLVLIAGGVFGLLPIEASADVRLAGLFSDRMVLQRDVKIPIWGRAEPGEAVTVTMGGASVKTTADASGTWRVELPPMAAGGPHEITVAGKNTVLLKDVLVGDVWLCGGQSNMIFPLEKALGAEELLKESLPQIRLLQASAPVRGRPTREYAGSQWMDFTSARGFSAVACSFGRELNKRLGIPIGLIQCGAGGTTAEAWTPREFMATNPALNDMIAIIDKAIEKHVAYLKTWPGLYEQWLKDSELADKTGRQVTPPPHLPQDPRMNPFRPSGLFNGGIAPLAGYAIKGIIFYQGESNAGFAYQYRELFPALIAGWRAAWGHGDLPFLFIQLPTYMPREPQPCAWAELREAQLMTWQRVPKTGMAVTIDLGADRKDSKQDPLHPPNKIPMGQRLALVARAVVYGETIVYSGPVYESCAVEGGKIRIKFTHIGSGLMVKGETLHQFTIAGKDRKFVAAQAVIDGDCVVVSSAALPEPVAVRYDWEWDPDPKGNLYNKDGLPASPFRTDSWPGCTADAKWWW